MTRLLLAAGLSTRGARRAAVALGAALVLAGSSGCRPKPGPDVVLITVDTLRADRLGPYGSTVVTPTFERLAREGTLFEHAVSPLPETRPSHFTLFTSRYPRDHGVVSNMLALGEEALTLPEVYSEAGYETAAFAGCLLFDEASGAHQGFDSFDVPTTPQRPSSEVVPRVQEWLAERRRARDAGNVRPFFLWVHLFDPHMPYEPPEPWNGGDKPKRVKRLPSFTWPNLQALAKRRDGDLPRWAFERGKELYDGEVAFVDHWLGRLIATLEEQKLWSASVLAVTADHGECLGNGVYFDHSHCLGEGALAVPLLLRAPGIEAGRRVETVVELLDVAPTLVGLTGMAVPASFRGRDLLSPKPEDSKLEDRDAFFQLPYYSARSLADRRDVVNRLRAVAGKPTAPILGELQMGVRRGRWKYVLRGRQDELYDLDADPAERRDRAAAEPELTRELRNAVRAWMREHPFAPTGDGDLSPELIENLRALGYL